MNPPLLLSMLKDLIATPSVSSVNPEWDQSNREVVELLAGWLGELGFRIEVLEVPGNPGKSNLVASAGSGPDGLILAGHTDTVPCDPHLWDQDPFTLTEKEGRLYGLGIADMKSFFPLVIEAVRDLDLSRLRQPLTILATADEESTMNGARSLADSGRRLGRHALIGEPTGLRPIRMHKGVGMESICLHGRSGHSSNPALGVSALEGMHRVMGEILAWRDELQQRYRNPLFAVETPTLNLGHIHGGDNPNRICAYCELQIDLRPLPGMGLDPLRNELRQRLEHLLQGSGLRLEIKSLFSGIPAMETPAEAAIVQATEQLTGQRAGAVAFGTEGPFLQQMGVETVILGPGDIDQAHQPNEFLTIERIDPMIGLLKSLVERFCL